MESHGLEVGTLSRELDNNKDPNAEEPPGPWNLGILRVFRRTGHDGDVGWGISLKLLSQAEGALPQTQ